MRPVFAVLCAALAWGAEDGPAILRQHCAECHSDRARASGFSIEKIFEPGGRRGIAVVPGHPEQSPLVQLIKGDLTPRMPMGRTLAASDIKAIEDWIRTMPPPKKVPTSAYRWPFEKPVAHPQATGIDGF
jgi:mono/diheme cytochrome c family protein